MSDLLIHSMAEFSDLILDVLHRAGARTIVEIGAEFGGMTQPLADFCARNQGTLTAIDPSPAPAFIDWVAANPAVRHIARPSLDVFADHANVSLTGVDAWIIDGDHNYYTVFNELVCADALAQREGRPLLAILHDVGWPCARRDMYYAPDRIPAGYRQPCSHDAGVVPGNTGYLVNRGFRGGGHFAWALHAGGQRNGVLTAVEDFCRTVEIGARRVLFVQVPAVFGLGILFDADAPWAETVAEAVIPFHENPLLAKLEANRLRNYLTVLDWQDGYIRRA